MHISPISVNKFDGINPIIVRGRINEQLLLEEDPSADAYRMYINNIKNYKRLTREEEKKYACEIKKGGQEALEASNALINGNLKLVVKIALRNKKRTTVPIMDLIQEGNLGLKKATELYNGKYAFSTYATLWINDYMRRAVYEKYNFITIPVNMETSINNIRLSIEKFVQENGREPSISEISQMTKFSPQKIKRLLRYNPGVYSLNTDIYDKKGKKIEVSEFYADENSIPPYEYSENSILQEYVKILISVLNTRQQEILKLNFGLFDTPQLTQSEIAKKFNISYQAIQHQIKKAVAKLLREAPALLIELRDEKLRDKENVINRAI